MTPKFKSGDVVIFVGWPDMPPFMRETIFRMRGLSVGDVCTIRQVLDPDDRRIQFAPNATPRKEPYYQLAEHPTFACAESLLQKRPDEQQQRFRDTLIPAKDNRSFEQIIGDLKKQQAPA